MKTYIVSDKEDVVIDGTTYTAGQEVELDSSSEAVVAAVENGAISEKAA